MPESAAELLAEHLVPARICLTEAVRSEEHYKETSLAGRHAAAAPEQPQPEEAVVRIG